VTSSPQTVSAGNSALIYAQDVVAMADVLRVWVVIIPPRTIPILPTALLQTYQHARDISTSFFLNYLEFPNSSIPHKFLFIEDVYNMLVDSGNRYLKQIRHQFLRSPDDFIFKANVDFDPLVFCTIC